MKLLRIMQREWRGENSHICNFDLDELKQLLALDDLAFRTTKGREGTTGQCIAVPSIAQLYREKKNRTEEEKNRREGQCTFLKKVPKTVQPAPAICNSESGRTEEDEQKTDVDRPIII